MSVRTTAPGRTIDFSWCDFLWWSEELLRFQKTGPLCCSPVWEAVWGFGYLPVPVRLAVCGLPMALSLTCNVPVLVPVWVGVNTTLMVQVDFPAKLVPHVFAETLKSPVVEITILVSATFCLLESVNTFAGLLVPTV